MTHSGKLHPILAVRGVAASNAENFPGSRGSVLRLRDSMLPCAVVAVRRSLIIIETSAFFRTIPRR